jgi:NADH:ubiquinone oxidoreductase subunit 6 (subunit J)
MSWLLPLLLGVALTALLAVHARPLVASLWLAASSALLSVILYLIGLPYLAVVELSVGAGLITVLLAFAVSMAEDETLYRPILPRWVAAALAAGSAGILLWSLWPGLSAVVAQDGTDASFFEQVWANRQADILLQVVVVFTGVVGVLNLLADVQTREVPLPQPDVESGPEPAREVAQEVAR